jgi:hypothetical protein
MEKLFSTNLDSYKTHEEVANYLKHSLGYSLYLKKMNETFQERTLLGLLTKYLEAISQIQLPELITLIHSNKRFQAMIQSHLQIIKAMIYSPEYIEERIKLPSGYLPAFLKVCSHFEK